MTYDHRSPRPCLKHYLEYDTAQQYGLWQSRISHNLKKRSGGLIL